MFGQVKVQHKQNLWNFGEKKKGGIEHRLNRIALKEKTGRHHEVITGLYPERMASLGFPARTLGKEHA